MHTLFDLFGEILSDVSEEQGERFHQDITEMENQCQGRWNINMTGDFFPSYKVSWRTNTTKVRKKEI